MTATQKLLGEIRNATHMRDRELVLKQRASREDALGDALKDHLREIAYLDEQINQREAELSKQQGADLS